ncbi:hypothetical protein [Streptomyces varsoviensis]|uniref:hypothetical protein n=1 Tax=Streptomyces varsoviensis TaxID=67373 RepID=UPI000AC9F260|nr:hypothetical protein [Streptomyces varsoviensis]
MNLHRFVLDVGLVLGQAAAVMIARRAEHERPAEAAPIPPPGPYDGPGEAPLPPGC